MCHRYKAEKIFSVQVIKHQQIQYRNKTEYFQYQQTREKTGQVKNGQHGKPDIQLFITQCAYHFKTIGMHIMINQFKRCCDMVSVCYHYPRIILLYRYHYRPCIRQRINLPAIDNGAYFQEAEQYLILTLQNNMIRSPDIIEFNGW